MVTDRPEPSPCPCTAQRRGRAAVDAVGPVRGTRPSPGLRRQGHRLTARSSRCRTGRAGSPPEPAPPHVLIFHLAGGRIEQHPAPPTPTTARSRLAGLVDRRTRPRMARPLHSDVPDPDPIGDAVHPRPAQPESGILDARGERPVGAVERVRVSIVRCAGRYAQRSRLVIGSIT